jgi:uncharacterized protein
MRVWIDLSNSPHPLLFAPVARRLESQGHDVLVTARDHAQTVQLARERWDELEVIGGPTWGGPTNKARLAVDRVRRLRAWARARDPDVALSHNSYAQIAAARTLGIRTVTAMDYEHQPANHIAFRLANVVLLPAVMADGGVRRMGATRAKRHPYDGLKEELYLGDFRPDPRVLMNLGVDRGPASVLVVARTPPTGALYHRSDNPLFAEVLRRVCREPVVRCVVLPRQPREAEALRAMGLPNLIVPEDAVDARSLIYASDLLIGAGGTMTREAALLGIPAVSLYAGRAAAVDRWLERDGKLKRVCELAELPPVRRREVEPREPAELRTRSERLIAEFTSVVVARPADGPGRPAEAGSLARHLTRQAARNGWRGSDPYEGLNASRRIVTPLKGRPLGRRLLIQAVKRSPVDLRPLLRIRPEPNGAAVAWIVSALARNGFMDTDRARALLGETVLLLDRLRLAGHTEPCWGYPFDVQTRVFFYSRRQPNTIATAFAGHGLLDAHAVLGDAELLERARGAGRFFLRRVPQTPTGDGAYFGYLPGDRTPIHNSNLLAASLLARLSALQPDADGFADAAAEAVRYTVARQRNDGSWPYGELPNLGWIDNFHTGYVLDALLICADAGVAAAEAYEAWRKGLAYYRSALVGEDGTPKYYPERAYPLDAQSAAQAIQTLSLAARRDPSCADLAWRVFGFSLRHMYSADGLPIFQRHRHWTNRSPHFRWVVAPTLLALSHLHAIDERPEVDPPDAERPEVAEVAA